MSECESDKGSQLRCMRGRRLVGGKEGESGRSIHVVPRSMPMTVPSAGAASSAAEVHAMHASATAAPNTEEWVSPAGFTHSAHMCNEGQYPALVRTQWCRPVLESRSLLALVIIDKIPVNM